MPVYNIDGEICEKNSAIKEYKPARGILVLIFAKASIKHPCVDISSRTSGLSIGLKSTSTMVGVYVQ